MARILVAGADSSLAHRRLLADLVSRLRADGHDAALWRTATEGPTRSVREADALVAVLDSIPADAAAAVALAHALDKPCLGLASAGQATALFAELTQLVEADDEAAWFGALPGFYDRIRPFSGRLVRDRIPELVREAGHEVTFRSLAADERPRFLKQKVASEAKELLAADVGQEKEEVADLLEALEAFILSRGFERDELRRVKDHKKKQRGGFERAFVVEATGTAPAAAPEPAPGSNQEAVQERTQASRPAASPPGRTSIESRAQAPPHVSRPPGQDAPREQRPGQGVPGARAPASPSLSGLARRATHAQPASALHPEVATGDDIDFEYTEATPAPAIEVDDVGGGRDVRAKFFEI